MQAAQSLIQQRVELEQHTRIWHLSRNPQNMEFQNESQTQQLPVELPNGAVIKVEVERTSTGREDVAFDIRPFKEVTAANKTR